MSSGGLQGNSASYGAAVSADGRFIAFESFASNLVTGDTNNRFDIFVHDRQSASTTRVSVSSSGSQANGSSQFSHISSDARIVAFRSCASNLVPDDTSFYCDVFAHDRQTGATTLIDVNTAGVQANLGAGSLDLSADGRFVAFDSEATNLVEGDTNHVTDVFVRGLQTGITTRVSVSSSGKQANYNSFFPSISADGRFVAFDSFASNLVAGDTNGRRDVFVHDLQTGRTTRVSVNSEGGQAVEGTSERPAISDDGRWIAYSSSTSNLVPEDTNICLGGTSVPGTCPDIFVHDRQTGVTARVSVDSAGNQSDSWSFDPTISPEGRFVAWRSTASNLVPGDVNRSVDMFVHDRQTGTTNLLSVSSDGSQGNANSNSSASLSADGRVAAFSSEASNLVAGDTNGTPDVFVREAPSVASCGSWPVTLLGTEESDTLTGGSGDDVIAGLGGDDGIRGLGGNDTICGGPGQDVIEGGGGRDVLFGQSGNDILDGGPSADQLIGDKGNDTLLGGSGPDELYGGTGDDTMDGGTESDFCVGASHVSGDTAVNCEAIHGVP
jgi:Tol biopolymer transport system component